MFETLIKSGLNNLRENLTDKKIDQYKEKLINQKLSENQKSHLQFEGKNILSWLETGATKWAQASNFALPKPETCIGCQNESF